MESRSNERGQSKTSPFVTPLGTKAKAEPKAVEKVSKLLEEMLSGRYSLDELSSPTKLMFQSVFDPAAPPAASPCRLCFVLFDD